MPENAEIVVSIVAEESLCGGEIEHSGTDEEGNPVTFQVMTQCPFMAWRDWSFLLSSPHGQRASVKSAYCTQFRKQLLATDVTFSRYLRAADCVESDAAKRALSPKKIR